jgi:hypothetical protein
MADLWDRIRNVWDRNLETPSPSREENDATIQALAAQRLAGRDEIALEVTAALYKVRTDIRQDWTQEALAQPGSQAELAAQYQARIEDYNRVALGLIAVGDTKLSVNVPNVIHPEEMQRGIQLVVEQGSLSQGQGVSTTGTREATGQRVTEELREIRESWVEDVRSKQMRPADAELYYAGRFDQVQLSVAGDRSQRQEMREAIAEVPAFSELKAQVQSQLQQANVQAESLAS